MTEKSTPPHIDEYRFGQIVIDGESCTSDVIIFPDRVMSNWWRDQGHALSVDDLQKVLAACPQVLIVGTGAYGRMVVPAETRDHVEEQGIEVISHKTEKACRIYNQIRQEKQAVAALHLTC